MSDDTLRDIVKRMYLADLAVAADPDNVEAAEAGREARGELLDYCHQEFGDEESPADH